MTSGRIVCSETAAFDIFKVFYSEDGELLIDPVKVASIGYGEGTVGKTMDDGETRITRMC